MQEEHDFALEGQFIKLLCEMDPELRKNTELAREFARELVFFTEKWISDHDNIEKYESELSRWIQLNRDRVKQQHEENWTSSTPHTLTKESGND